MALQTLVLAAAGPHAGGEGAAEAGPISSAGGSFWFPVQGSTTAAQTDWLFNFILWISAFFMLLIVGLLVAFVWNYRRRPGVEPERTATHHTPLELTWTIIPTILVVIIFYFGISGYMDIRTPPENAHEIQVTGQKWSWSFTYDNGLVDPELHVPVGEATKLIMRSEDVIHSLYIPAFRMKMDVVPGRYSDMYFKPTQVGRFQIFCAEYCGQSHSRMLSTVVVQTPEDYAAWLRDTEEKNNKKDPVALGLDLYHTRGCLQCHSTDGSRGIGPSFHGLFGRQEKLSDGSTITVDENYIHESIIEPQAKVVAGYAPVMPTFKGKLKDVQIAGIIAWIKTLK
ncbi:MAG: cytochrome c oxidase subunit II [Deltaproteobacteria bacterium]|nr:MAG: cytochrome c oxidase subunit II [Deltaproteobacteria bacterium]